MTREKKPLLQNKLIFKWVLPGLLFLWVIFIALQLNPEVPLSIILQNFSKSHYTHWATKELLAHHYAEGEFTAGQDNLGIVAVRFNTFIRINSDSVIFRIKEKGQTNWFYTNSYRVDQFQPSQEFTFGFPIQPNSKNKTYIFQVESVHGVDKDAIALSPIEPVFSAKYQFTRSYFIHQPLTIFRFIVDKLISVYTDFSTSFYFLAYLYIGLIGFVGYYLWLFLGIKFGHAKILIFIYLIFIGIDIFVPTLPFRGISLILLSVAWFILCIYYEYGSNVSFVLGICWLVMSACIRIAGFMIFAEYVSHWMYIFFIIGLLQLLIERIFPGHTFLQFCDVWNQEIVEPIIKFKQKR